MIVMGVFGAKRGGVEIRVLNSSLFLKQKKQGKASLLSKFCHSIDFN